MPEGWLGGQQDSSEGCGPIRAVYSNLGIGTIGDEGDLEEARLDAALGRAVPPMQEPQEIRVSYDSQGGQLHFQYLRNQEPYSFSVEAACEDGWVTWRESGGHQYLADSVSQQESEGMYQLRVGGDYDLIVHFRGSAVYSTVGFRGEETTERWSRFERTEE